MRMYRSICSDTPGGGGLPGNCRDNENDNSTNNPTIKSRFLGSADKIGLSKCQFVKLQYRYHLGWFKKVFGFLILISSLYILAMNEWLAIRCLKNYNEGLELVIPLSSPYELLPQNDGKLIFTTGYLHIPEPLEQHPYGVSIYAVKLKRRIQMYQWTEMRLSYGFDLDQLSFHYIRAWKDKIVDSSEFHIVHGHENPITFPIMSEVRQNPVVQLGLFTLRPELKDKFNEFTQFTSGERPENNEIKMHMGLYYHSKDIWNPSVGDLRVQFSFAGVADSLVSVLAKQDGNVLKPYYSEVGDPLYYLHEGKKGHLEILGQEYRVATRGVWWIRFGAWLTSIIGSFLASKTITLLKRRRPLVRKLMNVGPINLSLHLGSFFCLLSIGLVWSFFKPIIGFILICTSSVIPGYIMMASADDVLEGQSETSITMCKNRRHHNHNS